MMQKWQESILATAVSLLAKLYCRHLDLHSEQCNMGRASLTVFTRQTSGESWFLISSGGRSTECSLLMAAAYTMHTVKALSNLESCASTVCAFLWQSANYCHILMQIKAASLASKYAGFLIAYLCTCESVFNLVLCSVNL